MSKTLLLSASLLALSAVAANAETQLTDQVDPVVIVARDKAGLLEKQPSNTVFGIAKPLIETPRSASLVSDLTLERYGVLTLDGATKVSPGTHTASFYGVPGALNIRGTLAENYFRGFKRVENRGTYSTPIGGAARIEILRGPPTPVYGAGKVGGLVNFIPKSARDEGRFLAGPEGEVTATVGSYNKKLFTGQFGAPVTLGRAEGGVYVYGEAEDSHSYYKGIYPRHQTLEASADFDLGNGWSTAFGGMVFHSDGDVQTPGWNRLTQDLIDNRTYITGRDTTLRDADGNGKITPNEVGAYPYKSALYLPYGSPAGDGVHTLDVGVGTTRLDRRTVYISPADFSKTNTQTLYFDLAKDLGDDRSLKLQLFHDRQDNKRFVSYGYPSAIDAEVSEIRVTYAFPTELGPVRARTLAGGAHRWFEGRRRESFNSGLIALDRRDISHGVTATDTIDSPFDDEPGGIGMQWENDNRSTWKQTGVFVTTDIEAGRLNLVLGGRWDHYSVESEDTGILSYVIAGRQADDRDKATWNASLTYKTPIGLMPYASYAKAAALEMSQAGDVAPNFVADGSWLSSSDLTEAGVKFQLLRGTLIGSLAAYRQNRTQIAGAIATPTVQGTRAKGVELEVRWLASERLSFTFAGNSQRTTVKGPDKSFQYIPAYTAGVPGAQGYGGSYVVWDFSTLPGRSGDYAYTLTPKSVVSLYGTYTSKAHDWGQAGATVGASHVSRTAGTVQNAVEYPAYWLVNASAYVQRGPYSLSVNIDNLFNQFYFTPDADTYANLGALPGKGREWRATLKRTF